MNLWRSHAVSELEVGDRDASIKYRNISYICSAVEIPESRFGTWTFIRWKINTFVHFWGGILLRSIDLFEGLMLSQMLPMPDWILATQPI